MKILIIDNVEPHDVAFNEPLQKCIAELAEVESINYREVPAASELDAQYDAIVISGAPLIYANDVIDSRLPFLDWISQVTIPVLGICLGHQNMARLFGGDMIVDKEAENGAIALSIVQDDPLLAGIKTGDAVTEMHRVSVTLPGGWMQLASTKACPNQIMKHGTKPLYGVQFHPELSPVGHSILANFVKMSSLASATPRG